MKQKENNVWKLVLHLTGSSPQWSRLELHNIIPFEKDGIRAFERKYFSIFDSMHQFSIILINMVRWERFKPFTCNKSICFGSPEFTSSCSWNMISPNIPNKVKPQEDPIDAPLRLCRWFIALWCLPETRFLSAAFPKEVWRARYWKTQFSSQFWSFPSSYLSSSLLENELQLLNYPPFPFPSIDNLNLKLHAFHSLQEQLSYNSPSESACTVAARISCWCWGKIRFQVPTQCIELSAHPTPRHLQKKCCVLLHVQLLCGGGEISGIILFSRELSLLVNHNVYTVHCT